MPFHNTPTIEIENTINGDVFPTYREFSTGNALFRLLIIML